MIIFPRDPAKDAATDAATSSPVWPCTGILADLLQPLRTHDADECFVDETRVQWSKHDLEAAFNTSALGPARSRKLRRREDLKRKAHRAAMEAIRDSSFDPSRYTDSTHNWYAALLGEHLTDDDIFVRTLAGPTSTFITTIEQPLIQERSQAGPPRPHERADELARIIEVSVDIDVDWTARTIRLRRTAFQMGPTGSGKSTTLEGLIAALQAQSAAATGGP